MNKYKKIGWQKYEDYIEKQLTSPILHTIIQNVAMQHIEHDSVEDEDDDEEEDFISNSNEDESKHIMHPAMMLPLTSKLMDDVALLSTFDCWIGHTNFDITNNIKSILDSVPGVEVLKVLSRYRFFVGIGHMFDFAKVRKDIEKAIIGDLDE
jgi:hypothetical protein